MVKIKCWGTAIIYSCWFNQSYFTAVAVLLPLLLLLLLLFKLIVHGISSFFLIFEGQRGKVVKRGGGGGRERERERERGGGRREREVVSESCNDATKLVDITAKSK